LVLNQHIILTNTPAAIQAIYDEYAGMLLGYIYEVVKDKNLAEQYLVSVFNELPQHLSDIARPGTNIYHSLQLLTRKILADFFETIPACNTADNASNLPTRPNKFLDRMSKEEQLIFCSVHYRGKSISALAAELNKPEEVIKKLLQQAFAAIRRAA
jgi:DNA-directed RNA polymerase specialized sigma24 family protein